jgi:hypothetical protein
LRLFSLLVYKEARSVPFVVAFVVVSSNVRVVAAAAAVGKAVVGVADEVVVVRVVAIEKLTRPWSGLEETGLQQAAPWGSQACQMVEVVVAAVATAVVVAVVEVVIGRKRNRNGRETVKAVAAAAAVAAAVEAEHKDQLFPNG